MNWIQASWTVIAIVLFKGVGKRHIHNNRSACNNSNMHQNAAVIFVAKHWSIFLHLFSTWTCCVCVQHAPEGANGDCAHARFADAIIDLTHTNFESLQPAWIKEIIQWHSHTLFSVLQKMVELSPLGSNPLNHKLFQHHRKMKIAEHSSEKVNLSRKLINPMIPHLALSPTNQI